MAGPNDHDPTRSSAPSVSPPLHPDAAEAAESADVGSPPASVVLELSALAVAAFGFILGFNQLATQSPIDAILPVALVSAGFARMLSAGAVLVGGRTTSAGAGVGDPPSVTEGLAFLALALVAVAAVGWRWGLAAQASVVAALGLLLLFSAGRDLMALLRGHPDHSTPGRIGVTATQAALLLAFAVAAVADAGIRPFS